MGHLLESLIVQQLILQAETTPPTTAFPPPGLAKSAFRLEILTQDPYIVPVKATITSKGQITIPLRLRQKFHLSAGDELEFDEDAPFLTARRAINHQEWASTLADWQEASAAALKDHPWENQPSASIIDDLRGGPADSIQPGS